jgi:hypothetical protein
MRRAEKSAMTLRLANPGTWSPALPENLLPDTTFTDCNNLSAPDVAIPRRFSTQAYQRTAI